ncbi:DUF4097 family beta strand repeat-containing protein [Micromonospora aurantiaca]|uniref:DUF4097 family beta strand repeat-containing protein n=1 Tax=Micromonospora aurantiaca (nom. illeg.) TaxID=47850 RepID=UPI003451E3F0
MPRRRWIVALAGVALIGVAVGTVALVAPAVAATACPQCYGLSGELNLTSGGGAVDASGITPATITARTGGGAIQLTFTKPPESVRVDSSGGDVTLRLPRDRYSIDAQGSGGTTTVEIPTDAAAAHRIGVHSGGGDILVTAPE